MFKPNKPKRVATKNMKEQGLKNAAEFCRECEVMSAALDKGNEGEIDIGELRNYCTCCKQGRWGIFKADAIYSALKLDRQFRQRRGKSATIEKRYGRAIRTLREQKVTLKGIAETLGISINSVRSVLKKQID